jgi:ABC-type glycerol-3-phosphate transport system permease component
MAADVRAVGGAGVRASAARPTRLARRATLYLVTLALGLVFLFPGLWTLLSSLKTSGEIYSFPPTLLPADPQWSNYAEVVTRVPFLRWAWNSLVVALLATIGAVLSASIVAYSFARFEYPGRDLVFVVTLSTMMLPVEVTLIPQYLLFNRLDWLDSFKPLIVPAWLGGGAFYIFLLRQFLMTIPRELDDAAVIDGAGSFRVLWQILLPLCRPGLATAAVISFIHEWDAFLVPLIYLNSTTNFTLGLGLRYFVQLSGSEKEPQEHLLMAASSLVIAPLILLFFCAQRYFVRGIVMSGIKG